MIGEVTKDKFPAFEKACEIEHVFGSKILSAYRLFAGKNPRYSFYLQTDGQGNPCLACCLCDEVAAAVAGETADAGEFAAFLKERPQITEIDTNLEHGKALQKLLGGELESSYYMSYQGGKKETDDTGITFQADLREVFLVLCRSHPYYQAHLKYETWSADMKNRLEAGEMTLIQLNLDGQPVGTASIVSEDESTGAIAAVAVIPEYRNRGLGTRLTACLINDLLARGKQPVLISGYDAVSELYAKMGFVRMGRWGELYRNGLPGKS